MMEANTEDPHMAAVLNRETENSPLIDSDSDDGILSGYSLPTFPELTRSSSKEQQSLLTRSQYAMVVFHGVADTYPTDSDIVCRYSLTDGVEAAPGDRVVLFVVGWSSIKDYVVFEWAPIPEKDERDLTVVFKAADLPKDVNEFYQVCYVSNESAVCGASVPFQVRTPNNEELTFALEEDMVVVRSSTAVAQDKLLKAQLDRENLNKKKLNLEKQLRSLEDKHSLTLRRLDRLQETLSTSNASNEELMKENTRLLDVTEEMSCVKKDLEETQIERDNAREEIKALQIMFEEVQNDLAAAEHHITTLKMQHEEYKKVIAIAHEDLQRREQASATLGKKNFTLENELTVCKFNLDNAQLENLRLKKEMEDMARDNEKLNMDLKNLKQSAETNQGFFTEYSSTDRGRLIMNNTMLQRSTEEMQLTISALEHEKSTLEKVLEDIMDAQKNSCTDHCALEKRVAQLQYRLDEQTVEEKQSSSKTHQYSTSAEQVETWSKLLDDSFKESESRLEEIMVLRMQNQLLHEMTDRPNGTPISEEYVIVSSSDSHRPIQQTSTAQNDVNLRGNLNRFQVNVEVSNLEQRSRSEEETVADCARRLTAKDNEIRNLSSEMDTLKNDFLAEKSCLEQEINHLISKNAMLVEQEIQSQEVKNEMQRITFMNEELLVQNASLMERIHDDKVKSYTNTDENRLRITTDSQSSSRKSLEIENEHLKKQLESTCEKLNKVQKEAETVTSELRKYENFEKELTALKEEGSHVKSSYSALQERSEMLMQRLSLMAAKMGDKCYYGYCADPISRQINQTNHTDNLLPAWHKAGNCSGVKRNGNSALVESDELKYRLELARQEYEKLLNVMVTYRTKYIALKEKYMKIAGKRQNRASSCSNSN